MSTTGVSHSSPNAGKPVQTENKTSGTSERSKENSADTGASADLFALLLGLAGNALEPTQPAPVIDTSELVDEPASAGDPVQAMLQSRYPVTGREASDNEGTDLAALGMRPLDRDGSSALPEDIDLLIKHERQMNDPASKGKSSAPGQSPAAGSAKGATGHATATHAMAWRPSSVGVAGLQAGQGTTALPPTVSLLRGQEAQPWHPGAMARSTLTLDARTAVDAADLASGSISNGVTTVTGPSAGHGTSQPGGDGSQTHTDDGAADTESMAQSRSESSEAEAFQARADEMQEEMLAQWEASSLQHARLKVGDGDEALDVQLQLAGQTVQVELRTDDEQTRSRLMQDAGQTLAERLAQEGITLADLSLGGRQSSDARRDGRPEAPSTVALARGAAAHRQDETPATSAPKRRADGSLPLDLFV